MYRVFFIILCLACLLSGPFVSTAMAKEQADKKIEVALLTYNRGKTAACFATKFLNLAARKAKLNVSGSLSKIPLQKSELSKYPLVIFAGDLRFKLSDKEMANLKKYLQNGGFVIASAGCANEIWNRSFKKMMQKMLPDAKFEPLAMKHPVFHTIYDLKELTTTQGKKDPTLYGLKIKGRLVMIYSPVGVNDTAHAGGDCCCCGGEEILQSHLVNANILSYALTHSPPPEV